MSTNTKKRSTTNVNRQSKENYDSTLSEAIQLAEFEREVEEDSAELPDTVHEYEVNCYGGDYDIDGLVKRFAKKDIFFPDFQRNYVWTRQQACRFIESILIGLPIPSLFLYNVDADNRLLIIDGLQRLTTLHGFKNNQFPDTNSKFTLNRLPKGSRFYNRSYGDLEEKDQRAFDNTVIHILFIKQTAPDKDHSATFHIFERLNSGGTPLQAQEMRNAIYDGKFQKLLVKLNSNKKWRRIFSEKAHRRAKDLELILRFLALYNWNESYKEPMRLFLNKFMNNFREADDDTLNKFDVQFTHTLDRIYEALKDSAFRVGEYETFSAPFFDAFMVAVAENENASKESIVAAYKTLSKNKEFLILSRASTTTAQTIHKRIDLVRNELNATN